jgi:hypothetical protein
MRASVALLMTGIVVLGERRSRRVVKGSSEACWPRLVFALPPLREFRKFWTMAEASLDSEAALCSC